MLDDYLARIGHNGPLRIDAETLSAIHRAHITAVPYENLELQLGRPNVLAEEAFVEKLVKRRRGGWCYEMNGLLTRALRELGFSVTRVGGAVAREILGEAALGNHLVGLVDLERRYVADVGLMDGPLDAFPLEARSWREGRLEFRLERLDDGWWRFHNHAHGLARSGHVATASRAVAALVDVAAASGYRWPELYSAEPVGGTPAPYPASCRPQAWAAASAGLLVSTVLGLRADAPGRVLEVSPLPQAPFGALRVEGIRMAGRPVAIEVDGSGRVVDVQAPDGIEVRVLPSSGAGAGVAAQHAAPADAGRDQAPDRHRR